MKQNLLRLTLIIDDSENTDASRLLDEICVTLDNNITTNELHGYMIKDKAGILRKGGQMLRPKDDQR